MSIELTEISDTYFWLKNIAMSLISLSNVKSALDDEDVAFEYFIDDDQNEAENFESLYKFLHEKYFLCLTWARLTLNSDKFQFFQITIKILDHECSINRLKSSADKTAVICKWSFLTCELELMKFLYVLSFLRYYISDRTEYCWIMKTAIEYESKKQHKQIILFK